MPYRVASRNGNGRSNQHDHANLLLRAVANVLPKRAGRSTEIKEAIRKTYGKRGESIMRKAILPPSIAALGRIAASFGAGGLRTRKIRPKPGTAYHWSDRFGVRPASDRLCCWQGKGDLLPVSALPVDGSFPDRIRQSSRNAVSPHDDSHLGSRSLHRLCALLVGLPACCDSDEGVSAGSCRNGT